MIQGLSYILTAMGYSVREFTSWSMLQRALTSPRQSASGPQRSIITVTHIFCCLPCRLPLLLNIIEDISKLYQRLCGSSAPIPQWVTLSSIHPRWVQDVLKRLSTKEGLLVVALPLTATPEMVCSAAIRDPLLASSWDEIDTVPEIRLPVLQPDEIRILSRFLLAPASMNDYAAEIGQTITGIQHRLQVARRKLGGGSRAVLMRWRFARYITRSIQRGSHTKKLGKTDDKPHAEFELEPHVGEEPAVK